MNNSLINKAKNYVLSQLNENTPINNVYHNTEHTLEVMEAAEIIGRGMNVSENELEILILAAIFHDLGYLEKSEGHELVSAKYAEDFLIKENYSQELLQKIRECILATKVPQNPHNLLEKIICDADLSHLGKKSFDSRNNKFRDEIEFQFGHTLSEREWLQKSINFLKQHKFFTDFAVNHFEPEKKKNLAELQNALDDLNSHEVETEGTSPARKK